MVILSFSDFLFKRNGFVKVSLKKKKVFSSSRKLFWFLSSNLVSLLLFCSWRIFQMSEVAHLTEKIFSALKSRNTSTPLHIQHPVDSAAKRKTKRHIFLALCSKHNKPKWRLKTNKKLTDLPKQPKAPNIPKISLQP